MADEKAPEKKAEPRDYKKLAKRAAIVAVPVILGGLYQQGYISEEIYNKVLGVIMGLIGL